MLATTRFLLTATLAAIATPGALAQDDGVTLVGIARDFKTDHPDFGVSPALGFGHVAGNIGPSLSASGTPQLGSTGFQVDTQWLNRFGNPIAPRMYWVGPGPAVPVTLSPIVIDTAYADSFDPDSGPYGGTNVGPAPHFVVGSDMPAVSEPTGLPPSIPLWMRDTNKGTTTLSSDLHCDRFVVANHHTVMIDGDVTIVARDEFNMQNWAAIELTPGSRLTIYTLNFVSITDQCSIGASSTDCSRIRFIHLGSDPLTAQNQIYFYATVLSPYAHMEVLDGSEFFGSFIGDTMHLRNGGAYHAVGEIPTGCLYDVDDVAGVKGSVSDGDIDSNYTFGTWFRDAPGQNASMHHPITLYPDGTGFYEFVSNSFYPVDGQLYGNEGASHNRNFTYFVAADFIFRACQDQILELEGADDIWAYVDDELVIDLGGVGANQAQVAEVDRLPLVEGERYTLRIYFAHRSSSTPRLRIRTNLELEYNSLAADMPAFAGFD